MSEPPSGAGGPHPREPGDLDQAVTNSAGEEQTAGAPDAKPAVCVEERADGLALVVSVGVRELLRVPWSHAVERDAGHEAIATLPLPAPDLARVVEAAELADFAASEPPAVSIQRRATGTKPVVTVAVGPHELFRDRLDPDNERDRARLRSALLDRYGWVWPALLARVEHDLLEGWRREIVAEDLEVARAGTRDRKPQRREAPRDGRPEIVVGPHLDVLVGECVRVLADSGSVYVRGGSLVEVVPAATITAPDITRAKDALVIRAIGKGRVAELLATHAEFRGMRRGDLVPVQPPRAVAADLVERGTWPGVPVLAAIAHAPVLRSDGSILRTPGYDAASGLFGDFDPAPYADLPERPTRDDARAALRVLLSPLEEFALSDASRAVLLAAILTGLARESIAGPTPMFHVGATTPGAGKSLACDVVSCIVTGTEPAKTILPHDPEETRKVIASVARSGDRVVMFDNLNGTVGDRVLAAAITAGRLSIRLFGRLDTEALPLSVLWLSSGNNVRWQADLARRVLPAEIEVDCEQPELRHFERRDLLAWTRVHRAELVRAGLVILAAHAAAGRPEHDRPALGGFTAWDRVVRAALLWAGAADPCATRRGLREAGDADLERLSVVLPLWRDRFGDGGETVSGAIARAGHPSRIGSDDDLRAALSTLDGRGGLEPQRIGQGLAALAGRIHAGMRLARTGAQRSVVRWRVELVGKPDREGPEGPEGHSPPHAERFTATAVYGGGTSPSHPSSPSGVTHNGHPDHGDPENEERRAIQAEGEP